MSKKEKVKNFVKEHKGDIIRFSYYALGVGVGIGICKLESVKKHKEFMKDCTIFNIPNLTIKDFGKVGEEVISTIDEVTKDTPVKGWYIDYLEK